MGMLNLLHASLFFPPHNCLSTTKVADLYCKINTGLDNLQGEKELERGSQGEG